MPNDMKEWRIRPIEWEDISRYRNELMGLAMLLIVLFHVPLDRFSPFFGLRRCGNIGVDIFFFLSGIGLWFSWTETPSLKHFFAKRYLRIYPAWLIITSLYYIPDYIRGGGHSNSIPDLIGDIALNLDFWLYDELTFWYIPAIMMLYTFAPAYISLIKCQPSYRWLALVFIIWCFMVQWIDPVHHVVGHIEIFWSRIPIFLIGINVGQMIKEKQQLSGSALWLILLLFVLTLGACIYLEQAKHGRFPLFIERMLYIPLTVCGVLLFSMLVRYARPWLLHPLSLIGTLSLEFYLIHAHFILPHIQQLHVGYTATALLTILTTWPCAWLLHQIAGRIEKLFKYYSQ